jgi:DNA helicase-2/ATP-dependent DNA helicase PcrA
LVKAAPGSGKTRVIIARIRHLVDLGTDPDMILAVTFTNKAAMELKSRLIAEDIHLRWVGTFHHLAYRLSELNDPQKKNIAIQSKQNSCLLKLMRKYCLDCRLDRLQHLISSLKTKGLTCNDSDNLEYIKIVRESQISGVIFDRLFAEYQSDLDQSNSLDFDDVMLRLHLQYESGMVNNFDHILIDEFQDTNTLQYKLAVAWTKSNQSNNVMLVGDTNQSIYGWRHADYRNIEHFLKIFPHTHVVRLYNNYRSSPQIIKCANQLIPSAKMCTENPNSTKVELEAASDPSDEAEKMVHIVKKNPKLKWAILVRGKAQIPYIQEAFQKANIQIQANETVSFFEQKPVKLVMSYFNIIVDSFDKDSWRYVLKSVGMDYKTIESCLKDPLNNQNVKESKMYKIYLFIEHRNNINQTPTRILEDLIDQHMSNNKNQLHILADIMSGCPLIENFIRESHFVNDISLQSDAQVTISTIHSAKGLEWDGVIIPGVENGNIPHKMSRTDEDLAQEKRLFYVAITRAKQKLVLMWSHTRMVNGKIKNNQLSQFMKKIVIEQKKKSMISENLQNMNAFENFNDIMNSF